MRYADLLTDETPHCVWDWELDRLDREFLNGLDPTYFEYMAKHHVEGIDGDEASHAALALRNVYSHAQETFLSLVAATVQAPACVIGWLHKYRNEELDEVVRKLSAGLPVRSRLKWDDFSWPGLARLIHRFISIEDKGKQARITEEFGRFWNRIAADFLDEQVRREYNSIKHGLRVRSGGFTLTAGAETTPGVPCLPEQMKTIGGSPFGSNFYVPDRIEGVDKCNIRFLNSSRNWLPEQLAYRTILMSMSMTNVLSFLKIVKGDAPERQQFVWPGDFAMFELCWQASPGVTEASFNDVLTKQDIQPRSKQQILDAYTPAVGPSVSAVQASPESAT